MAKRLPGDRPSQSDVDRASKKARKLARINLDDTATEPALTTDTSASHTPENYDSSNKEERPDLEKALLSKEERRALRRTRKEQRKEQINHNAGLVVDNIDDSATASEAARKALKRAEKAARKSEKAAKSNGSTPSLSNGVVDTNEATNSDASAAVPDVSYNEHEELRALPQAEIDSFVSDSLLTFEDPHEQKYRPIVSFKYLPREDGIDHAQFADFAAPTPVQAACWPYLFAGRDIVGVAETGSGKTLAFGVPCIRYIAQLGKKERRHIKSCIVSPTRELAVQIFEQLEKVAKPAGLKASCVYGGTSKDEQRATLRGAQIVVATPGRLNDFVQEGSIDLSQVTYLVLDEADRIFDKGFEPEVRKIISATPSTGRQTLMFTATWPQSVRDIANSFMDNPVKVTVGGNPSGELRANARIEQEVQVIDEYEKQARLIQLLKQYQSGKNKNDRILVFCLYKKEATRIEEFIRRKGFPVAGIHGDLNQQRRTESLDAFKRGTTPLLVGTDVAARGLDIPAVKVVINVTFPLTVEDYVHRIGR